MGRGFKFARKIENGVVLEEKAYEDAKLPVYMTKASAGADFYSVEEVTVPSIWGKFLQRLVSRLGDLGYAGMNDMVKTTGIFAPTMVHTGIKAFMDEDECLELYNRSGNPKKFGLVLANSVGVVDADYYENPDNDGEIMLAFYNFLPFDVRIPAGTRLGQGVFKKYLRPTENLNVLDNERTSGHGSTGN